MKKMLPIIPVFLVLAFPLTSSAQVKPGAAAPSFTATDIEGKTHKLSDYKGKIVVLEAINLDCPFSGNHYKSGAMQELQEEMTKQGVVWLAVNSSNPKSASYRKTEEAKKEWEIHKMKATALLDDSSGKLGKAYGLMVTPHMVVVNKEGKVAYVGAIDDKAEDSGDPRKARNYVREAVQKISKGEAPTVVHTKPYGCGIKYGN